MPSNASLEPANPLVAAFIGSRLTTHRKDFSDSTIVEGACRYFLERDADQPHLVHISVQIASSPFADQLLPEGHQQLLQHIAHKLMGFAAPAASTKPGCLLTVDAHLTALAEQDTAAQASSIACLASLHATAASWQIRGVQAPPCSPATRQGHAAGSQTLLTYSGTRLLQLSQSSEQSWQQHSLLLRRGILGALCTTPAQPAAEPSGAVLVFCSRPEQPFFVQPGPDHVLVVYPIWLPTGASRAYTACFMQGFTESRKTGDMPASTYSSSQALPVLVPQQCRQRVAEADGGFVTVTLQPHHLKSDSLDRVAWSVLTFHEYMSLHVKSFQAFIHSKMRKRMNMMMMELAQAKATFDA